MYEITRQYQRKRLDARVHSVLQDLGFTKPELKEIAHRAKRFALTPEEFVKRTVEIALEDSKRTWNLTFAQIMQPAPEVVDEAELAHLVDKARIQFHKKKEA